jgi:hypothetical protein
VSAYFNQAYQTNSYIKISNLSHKADEVDISEFLDDIRIQDDEEILFHNPGNDQSDRYAIVKLKCATEIKEALSYSKRRICGKPVEGKVIIVL